MYLKTTVVDLGEKVDTTVCMECGDYKKPRNRACNGCDSTLSLFVLQQATCFKCGLNSAVETCTQCTTQPTVTLLPVEELDEVGVGG